MMEDDLACKELVELVSDYLEGALAPDLRDRFEAHLEVCDGCTTYLEQMHETLRLLRQVPSTPPEPAVRADLLRLFGDWKQASN
jgi:anti-sigma factor RsiW